MDIYAALGVTYAAVGQEMSDAALQIIAHDLAMYPPADVYSALSRCRKELRRIALADIIDRLPNQHPGPEEAWSMIAASMGNEALSIVWTEQMRLASGTAWALADDKIAARMAFKEAYQREVAQARERGERPQWSLSPGTDKATRESVILQNVQLGRLPEVMLLQLPAEVREGHPQLGSAIKSLANNLRMQ